MQSPDIGNPTSPAASVPGFFSQLVSSFRAFSFKNLSFRSKASLFLIPLIAGISFAHTMQAITAERAILRNELIKKGETVATIAARNAELPILSENAELLNKAVLSLSEIKDVLFVEFYSRDAVELIHFGPAVEKRSFDAVSPDGAMTFFERPLFYEFVVPVFAVKAKEDIDIFQEAMASNTVREKIGWARIGFSKAIMQKAENEIMRRGILFALFFTVAGVVFGYALITVATRPLETLFRAVKEIREGDYPEVDVNVSGHEFGRLSAEFNRMSRAIKEREGRIIASEKRIQTLFERVEHALFRIDGEGNISEANSKFNELCSGITTFSALFPYRHRDICLQRATGGLLKNTEIEILDRDGNEFTAMISVYPVADENDQGMGYDGYFVDISEKRRLEEALVQTQKMESVGLLAGGIAHDFNNILTGVLGYASLMKSMTEKDDKMYEYADIIEKSAVRASNITHQLLSFARKGKYRDEVMNVNDIVCELVAFLKETFDRNITIVMEKAGNRNLLTVTGDGNQLYQALMNLCINARDAMPEGGRLYIRTDFCSHSDAVAYDLFNLPPGEYVEISVTDTGTGMPSHVRKRIFEPFYTTKGTGKGTGLGLAMVYGIIKSHGGYIDIYSEVDLGTTARVYLPRTEGKTAKEEMMQETLEPKKRRGRILFIDDEAVVRELGREILEAYGYTVMFAADGVEGISKYIGNMDAIDLVILDMVLPEKGGRQVFSEIREANPGAKVILCSGYGQDQYFHEIFEAGASGFIQKPFQHGDLIRKIEEVLGDEPSAA